MQAPSPPWESLFILAKLELQVSQRHVPCIPERRHVTTPPLAGGRRMYCPGIQIGFRCHRLEIEW